MFDLKVFSDGVTLLGSVVSTVKSIIDMLPKDQKEEASRVLADAEKKLQLHEALAAQGLGYELCRCTWPPQIMVQAGEVEYGEIFRCPTCNKVVSPDDMPPFESLPHNMTLPFLKALE